MMGEMGEIYRAWKPRKKQARDARRIRNTEKVNECGLEVKWIDHGKTARICYGEAYADFWPSSGKWHLSSGKYGEVFETLMKEIKKQKESGNADD